jgi:hypothetical protein
MAESSTEKGVNEISKGVENIDNEFKSDRKPERSLNQKRNQARKSKKKQRQNKKGGRR